MAGRFKDVHMLPGFAAGAADVIVAWCFFTASGRSAKTAARTSAGRPRCARRWSLQILERGSCSTAGQCSVGRGLDNGNGRCLSTTAAAAAAAVSSVTSFIYNLLIPINQLIRSCPASAE